MSKGILSFLLVLALLCSAVPAMAGNNSGKAGDSEGFESGENWFGEDFAYDIHDEAACWELLMKPITVLDVGEKESIYPRKTPDGEKVVNDKLGGFINGATAAVHVLGEDENGWTLIEGMDYYDRLIRGYVKTKLLKQRTPYERVGVIIDKLYQRLYVFKDGKLWSSCAVSTGLVNDEQPYNETACGEYLTASWVGGFDSEGMLCDMGIRFNNGDLLHQVPYVINADGSKNFKWEKYLGQKASHGCVRVARTANEDGLNQQWLWDNLKKGTKVVIWDDDGRRLPYPDDSIELYYNPESGKYYHSTDRCSSIRDKYLPLKGSVLYSHLDEETYAALEPCPVCTPVKRKSVIDEMNAERGFAPVADGTTTTAPDENVQIVIKPAATPSITVEEDEIVDPAEFLGVDNLDHLQD